MSTLPRPVRREVIPGARGWSVILRRGYQLQLIDREGGANCSALFFNAAHLLERYNMAYTLKDSALQLAPPSRSINWS